MDALPQSGKFREREIEHHLLEMVDFFIQVTNRYGSCVSLRAKHKAAIIYLGRVKTIFSICCCDCSWERYRAGKPA